MTEQDKIKALITDVQKAAEEKNVTRITSFLSKNYRDSRQFTYATIKSLLAGFFFRYRVVHVYITDFDITVDGERGSAVFQAVLTGGPAIDAAPESLAIYIFEIDFKKEKGDWMATSARWTRAGVGHDTPGTGS